MFYFYILQSIISCEYYIGSTEDLKNRLLLHNKGMVKSTKSNRPWKLVYFESFSTLREARKRELQVKKWKSRLAIERLIRTF
ncbi:MAG: GIY-YIG nuclease family protein [bacterium]|nr:GIY-YIG nuclease family protein [bacterium]